MYGGGSNQVSRLKQPPARREPKKKPLEDLTKLPSAPFVDSNAILRARKIEGRDEERTSFKDRMNEGKSYDRKPYELLRKSPLIYDPSAPLSQRLEQELELDLRGKTSIPVGQREIVLIGHGCGYVRGSPIQYNLTTEQYEGFCSLTGRVCKSSPQQIAEDCPLFQKFLARWAQEDALKRTTYEVVESILPLAEND